MSNPCRGHISPCNIVGRYSKIPENPVNKNRMRKERKRLFNISFNLRRLHRKMFTRLHLDLRQREVRVSESILKRFSLDNTSKEKTDALKEDLIIC